MKTVMIIIDGLGDEPIPELSYTTPLESAFIPNMQYIAGKGKIGCMKTTFPEFPIESMVCIMGLLGYEPKRYYPHGRASFEALAKGISLGGNDLILRCNIIAIDKEKEIITDFTAGLISDSNARKIISNIVMTQQNWELYPGQSYRNVLIIRGASVSPSAITCIEPHMHIGESISVLMPTSKNATADKLAHLLREFIAESSKQIEKVDLPLACSANMLWVWSPSVKPNWPSFKYRTGLKSAIVGGLDFLHGIAMAAGIHFDVIPGATGYIDTDFTAKGSYTIRYLQDYDFVLTHINATDEEAHQRNPQGKRKAIEMIDRCVVGPILSELKQKYPDQFRIVVCGDHNTRCSDGKHTDSPVPFAMMGSNIKPGAMSLFNENNCLRETVISSIDFFQSLIH